MHNSTIHMIVGPLLLALFAVADWYLLRHPSALRDAVSSGSAVTNRPYSFSRVQLWWWTNVIIVSTLLVYTWTVTDLPTLNATCLTLLGIGLGTNAAGRIIDGHDQSQQNPVRHQDSDSKGFFSDILSDNNGISIHRFQALAFNVIYGVTFVISVIEDIRAATPPESYFPVYSSATLGLLVASASTYIVVKTNENSSGNAPKSNPVPANPSNPATTP